MKQRYTTRLRMALGFGRARRINYLERNLSSWGFDVVALGVVFSYVVGSSTSADTARPTSMTHGRVLPIDTDLVGMPSLTDGSGVSDGWEAVEQKDVFGTAHVFPINDLIMHEFEDCVCGVKVEPISRDDGGMGWLVKHFALDRREDDEEDGIID